VAEVLGAELDLLTSAARTAGSLALDYQKKPAKVWLKAQNSPVSEADIAVNDLLSETLRGARPDYGWLSEESEDDGSRLRADRTFIVDPIDGTRSFIDGGTDWTIPIAIVEDGRPIAAVLIAPRRDEFYDAASGGGSRLNGRPIHVSHRRTLTGAALAVSRRFLRGDAGDGPVGARTVFYASLAYRLARIADGRLDGAAIKADARDWDLAAADLLVHEAGGLLADLDGNVPRYDRADTSHPPLIAGPPALAGALAQLARSMAGTVAAPGPD